MFTPVPWKLLDDVSIWTQNWPWIPQPAHGPVEVKQSFCTLCPQWMRNAGANGGGLAGRCCWSERAHPITRGRLCPLGFAAHQLNWHPQRLRTVRHGRHTFFLGGSASGIRQGMQRGPVVIVDASRDVRLRRCWRASRKSRMAAIAWCRARRRGRWRRMQIWSGVRGRRLGYDLENARTIVSFGAPLLDGWGTPGTVHAACGRSERRAAADPQLRLIQMEVAPRGRPRGLGNGWRFARDPRARWLRDWRGC